MHVYVFLFWFEKEKCSMFDFIVIPYHMDHTLRISTPSSLLFVSMCIYTPMCIYVPYWKFLNVFSLNLAHYSFSRLSPWFALPLYTCCNTLSTICRINFLYISHVCICIFLCFVAIHLKVRFQIFHLEIPIIFLF